MSLSDQNLESIRALKTGYSGPGEGGWWCIHEDAINRLLVAARAEGAVQPTQDLTLDLEPLRMVVAGHTLSQAYNAPLGGDQFKADLATLIALAEGAPAAEGNWRPISEMVETVQEGFVLVFPTAARVPEVWDNQTYFEALRQGSVPGWAHLFEDAQAVTLFKPVHLPSEDHLKADGATPAQGVGTQGQGGEPASEEWAAIPSGKRFGRRLTADAVEHLAVGTLLRFYSDSPWFEPGPRSPRNGEIVTYTGAVSNQFPRVGPHLEVAALSGGIFPGGGWVFHMFQFVGEHPATSRVAG